MFDHYTVGELETLLARVEDKTAKVRIVVKVNGGTQTQNIEGFETAYDSTIVRLKTEIKNS